MRQLVLSTILVLGLAATPALATPCKDARGRFVKCTETKKPPVRCKDVKGRFVKCGTVGAKPA